MISIFPGLAWFALTGGMVTLLALGLAGIGLIAGGVGLAALLWLAVNFLVQLLIRYARLHFQLIYVAEAGNGVHFGTLPIGHVKVQWLR